MAHKRMFSRDIVESDAFLEMPISSQALYFHLGMEADDDGFLGNYKRLMRVIGSSEDDLNVLLAKRFILQFPSKVLVVKHWRIHNSLRKDRYTETPYREEKSTLRLKDNRAYTDDISLGLPSLATKRQPTGNIEEYSKEEKRRDFAPRPNTDSNSKELTKEEQLRRTREIKERIKEIVKKP